MKQSDNRKGNNIIEINGRAWTDATHKSVIIEKTKIWGLLRAHDRSRHFGSLSAKR